MTRVIHLDQHEVRLYPVAPPLIYIRFRGDLRIEQARALAQLLGQQLPGSASRFLVQAADLGTICPDSRRELLTSGTPAYAGHVLDIVIVGASLLHKVVLSQIVSMASLDLGLSLGPGSLGQPYFFDSIEDALHWLELPVSLLGA